MKSPFQLPKLLLTCLLAMVPIGVTYSQNTGTSSQPGTTSQSQSSAQTQSTGTPVVPTVGETQTALPQPGTSNQAPNEAARRGAWGWLILGFAIGLLVGTLAWRRSTTLAVREDIRRDRIA